MSTSIKKKSLPEQPLMVPWVDILQDAEDVIGAVDPGRIAGFATDDGGRGGAVGGA